MIGSRPALPAPSHSLVPSHDSPAGGMPSRQARLAVIASADERCEPWDIEAASKPVASTSRSGPKCVGSSQRRSIVRVACLAARSRFTFRLPTRMSPGREAGAFIQ